MINRFGHLDPCSPELAISIRMPQGSALRRIDLCIEQGDGSGVVLDLVESAFAKAGIALTVTVDRQLGSFIHAVAGIAPSDWWFWRIDIRRAGERFKAAPCGIDHLELGDIACIAFVASEIKNHRSGGDENSRT